MRRRDFIALLGASVAWPGDAIAQPAAKVRRIGVLLLSSECPPPRPLVESLASLGWSEGQTVAFDCISALGRFPDLSAIAADLVTRRPDVIVSGFLPAIDALKAATSTIPIVMLNIADPVRFGIIQSLSRPGGNVTGVASALGELDGKRIGLLKEMVPKLRRLAILTSRAAGLAQGSALDYFDAVEKTLLEAGDGHGFSQESFLIIRDGDLPSVFSQIASKGFDAIYPIPGVLVESKIELIGRLANGVGLPTIGWYASQAKVGLLMSYGPNEERKPGRSPQERDRPVACGVAGHLWRIPQAILEYVVHRPYLLLSLQYHVEWCLSRSPYSGETSRLDDVSQPPFSSLCAERHSDFLRKGRGHANHRGKPVGKTADRVNILFQMIPGNRFHQHPCPI
jgi:putative ABC transport system substrate-binding protein